MTARRYRCCSLQTYRNLLIAKLLRYRLHVNVNDFVYSHREVYGTYKDIVYRSRSNAFDDIDHIAIQLYLLRSSKAVALKMNANMYLVERAYNLHVLGHVCII